MDDSDEEKSNGGDDIEPEKGDIKTIPHNTDSTDDLKKFDPPGF